jgi:hypothetical protein
MEKAVAMPEQIGWYRAWGSAPWGWIYFGYCTGKEMKYYIFEYGFERLKLKLANLRENEFIHEFIPITGIESEAMSRLEITS